MSGSYFTNERLELLPFVPPDVRRALDVGAAHGGFGRALKEQRDCEVWGIEPNAEAAAAARSVLDRVLACSVEQALAQLPDGAFDLVVLNDSLEHLPDPEATLSAMTAKLGAGGRFLCSIPNVRYYKVVRELVLRGEWEYVDEGVMDRTHLRFFTHKSIRRMFERLDCELLAMEGIHGRDRLGLVLLNALSLGRTWDLRYKQFACLARPRAGAPATG
jgi:2-polyprenyl-3-methyl-5-hydroxy-6-metoxy-1,4-benzoquinol methylase